MSVLAEQHSSWKAARRRLWPIVRRAIRFLPPAPIVEPEPVVEAPPVEPVNNVTSVSYVPTWLRIIMETSKTHGVTREEITGPCRHRLFVLARNEAIFRMRTETDMSTPAIGRRFGRDHSTVLAAVRRYVATHEGADVVLATAMARQAARTAMLDEEARALRNSGLTSYAIMEKLGMSRTAVQKATGPHSIAQAQ